MIATAHKFEIGQTYSTRSACDYEAVFSYRVIARTAKTVTLENRHGHVSRRGITTDGYGCEYCRPQGRYSMAPVITADNPSN